RGPPYHGPPERRHRGSAGLQGPRAVDPPGSSGAAAGDKIMTVAEMRKADTDVNGIMQALGAAAKDAARALATVPPEQKNRALREAAKAVRAHAAEILAANAKDLASAKDRGLSGALIDRLTLNEARIEGMAKGLEEVADLADPVGETI